MYRKSYNLLLLIVYYQVVSRGVNIFFLLLSLWSLSVFFVPTKFESVEFQRCT